MSTLTERVYGNDTYTKRGARKMKDRIERYWRERGYAVHVEIKEAEYEPSVRARRIYAVSDLVNGLPRGYEKRGSQ